MKNIILPVYHSFPDFLSQKRIYLAAVIITLSLSASAQLKTQVPQIAWGRYFDDPSTNFDFSGAELGDKIYYFGGNIYIVGRTYSDSNMFVNCSGDPSSGKGDGFVASYNPTTQKYNWIRYWGGTTSVDYAFCAAFDKSANGGCIYIGGESTANGSILDLPLAKSCVSTGCTSIFEKNPNDLKNAWIAKYNLKSGKLIRWTYFGGKRMDQVLSMEVDTVTHDLCFSGYTESKKWLDYDSLGLTPYKPLYSGVGQAMIGVMDSCLTTLKYFTYYGGDGWDRSHDITIMYANNTRYLIISGTSQSISGIVPPGAACWDSTYGGTEDLKSPDAFLLIWNEATLSSPPDWSTYYGSTDIDRGRGVDITSNNDIWFEGQTESNPETGPDAKFFPTSDAYQSVPDSGLECFLVKLHIDSFSAPMGVHPVLMTFFGGRKDDYAKSVCAFFTKNSAGGNDTVAIAGLTNSNDLPDSLCTFLSQPINGNGSEVNRDAFMAVLTKDPAHPNDKQKLSTFTYLGGQKDETDLKINGIIVQKSYNPGIALGPNGSVFIVYSTNGTKTKANGNIPVEYSAFHTANGAGGTDAYFAQVYPFLQHIRLIPDARDEDSTSIDGSASFSPVPFSSSTTLYLFSEKKCDANVFVYDLAGRMMMEKKIIVEQGSNSVPFDFSSFAPGIYLSRIVMEDEVREVKIEKRE